MYELGIYIPEDDILHGLRRENLKSYIIIMLFPCPPRQVRVQEFCYIAAIALKNVSNLLLTNYPLLAPRDQ
jgi:hypothetical protein